MICFCWLLFQAKWWAIWEVWGFDRALANQEIPMWLNSSILLHYDLVLQSDLLYIAFPNCQLWLIITPKPSILGLIHLYFKLNSCMTTFSHLLRACLIQLTSVIKPSKVAGKLAVNYFLVGNLKENEWQVYTYSLIHDKWKV